MDQAGLFGCHAVAMYLLSVNSSIRSNWAARGVSDAGSNITGHSSAKTGPVFLEAMAAGKFHRVTRTATPIARRSTSI